MPRGVVAAATASLYSLRLEDIGEAGDILLPLTFTVIIALAVVYGVRSVAAARWLGVARPRPRGALVVGDRPWALGLAGELSRNGVPTVLAARGRADLAARDDLPFSVHASLLIDPAPLGSADRRAGRVSHDVLERSLAAGGRVTTIAGTDLPEGALLLARVRADGSWTASAAGPFAPDDRLVCSTAPPSGRLAPGRVGGGRHAPWQMSCRR